MSDAELHWGWTQKPLVLADIERRHAACPPDVCEQSWLLRRLAPAAAVDVEALGKHDHTGCSKGNHTCSVCHPDRPLDDDWAECDRGCRNADQHANHASLPSPAPAAAVDVEALVVRLRREVDDEERVAKEAERLRGEPVPGTWDEGYIDGWRAALDAIATALPSPAPVLPLDVEGERRLAEALHATATFHLIHGPGEAIHSADAEHCDMEAENEKAAAIIRELAKGRSRG